MKNWKRLDDRTLRVSARRIGLAKNITRNYRSMLKDLQEEDSGIYEVRCLCFCGRIHRHIAIIKEGHEWCRTYRKDLKNNTMPMVTCNRCETKIKQYKGMGIKENLIPKLLGWKGKERGAA